MTDALRIRIKKKTDGSAALSCVRADGSVTWQRQEGTRGRFFPLHDLTHYAVETELGLGRGFYGLVAEGWDLTDFGAPWSKGHPPDEAAAAELIVGFLDTERASGTRSSAEDFNSAAARYFAEHRVSGSWVLSDEVLERIRRRRGELFERWAELPQGETLELHFGGASQRAGSVPQ